MKNIYIANALPLLEPDTETILALIKSAPPADAAETLASMECVPALRCLSLMPPARRGAVFGYLPLERQAALIAAMGRPDARVLFSALPGDEQADLYKRLPQTLKEELLSSLADADRKRLLTLATYPEWAAGSVATTDFAVVSPGTSAASAIEGLRAQGPDRETIYVLYVLDRESRLLGTLSLRELLFAPPEATMGEIMRPEPIFLNADAPQKEAADIIRKYDLLALPLVDGNGKMLGIITVDDAMDVAEMEDAAKLARFGGSKLNTSELDLRETGLARMFSARFFWLAVLTLFGVLTSNLVAAQEALLSETIILAAFLAPIIDMGGNTGSQSATLVIRAMALGQVRLRWKDVWFVMRRDIPVAVALGLSIAVLEAFLAFASKGVSPDIMLVVGLSMLTVTVAGSLAGLLLPFAAKRIGTDPATLSSPLITSIMDLFGVLVYFAFAYAFLGDTLA